MSAGPARGQQQYNSTPSRHATAASDCSIMHSEQGSALGTLEEAREKVKWPNVKDIGGQVPAILQKWFPAA